MEEYGERERGREGGGTERNVISPSALLYCALAQDVYLMFRVTCC